ncbi:unnamed protein product [Paramecium sonneborni]|uniref:Uncharacterized protein n=1 Tax=Paramecium sonneborni TaxID=65129 RepID=A0A8S1KJV4_9CILI|nr:unnamed protein product [Paramecium sonneborni]
MEKLALNFQLQSKMLFYSKEYFQQVSPNTLSSIKAIISVQVQLLKNDYLDDNRDLKILERELEESQGVARLREEIGRINQIKNQQIDLFIY